MLISLSQWYAEKKKPKLPKLNTPLPDYSDVMGGFWGNHIQWFDKENYTRVWGHKPWDQRLKVGDTILSEHEKSFMWFVITDIDYKSNPHDMFFADVVRVHREMKPYNPETFRFADALLHARDAQ